ncbi:hypothetical protein D9M68_815210 [compost metagenome]
MRKVIADCGEPKSVVWLAAEYAKLGVLAVIVRLTVLPDITSISYDSVVSPTGATTPLVHQLLLSRDRRVKVPLKLDDPSRVPLAYTGLRHSRFTPW